MIYISNNTSNSSASNSSSGSTSNSSRTNCRRVSSASGGNGSSSSRSRCRKCRNSSRSCRRTVVLAVVATVLRDNRRAQQRSGRSHASCPCLPEPLLALLRSELVEGPGLVLAQEGLVVVVRVVFVVHVVFLVTQLVLRRQG